MSMELDSETLRKVAAWMIYQADLKEPVVIQPEEPDPEIPEPKQPEPDTPVILFAHGDTVEHARSEYKRLYGKDAVDCDPDGVGGWTCFSAKVDSPLIVPETPTVPVITDGSSMIKLPVKGENRFKYTVNSSSDSAVYTDNVGVVWQIFVFYNEDRETCVSKRKFPHGEFEPPINIHRFIGGGAELEYDNHNNAAVGVAGDGTIFVTANHHVDPLRMAVTMDPYDLTSFAALDRKNIPDHYSGQSDTDRVTYPSFFHHRGYLCLSYREQEAGGGISRFRWILKKYDHKTDKWLNMASINHGHNLRLYVSNIATSHDGNRIHFAALWRNDNVRDQGTEHQRDYFHMYSDNGTDWYQYNGSSHVKVTLPVSWVSDGMSTVPVNIWTTTPIPNGAGSIAIDTSGNPHMLMDIRGGQLVYHWHDSQGWQEKRGFLDTADDDLFPIGDGMGAVSHKGDSIFFHKLDKANKPTTVLLASGYVSDDFNVSVDRSAILRGYLSVMLTKNKSASPRSTKERYATDVYMMTIPLDDLAGFDKPWRL